MPRDVTLLLVLVALVAVAGALLARDRAFDALAPARAVARGALQLGAVALALRGALELPAVVGAVVLVMLAAVTVTAGRRLGGGRRLLDVLVAAALGASVPLALLLLSGAFEVDALLVVAFAGILLGGTMTACTLTGRRLRALVQDRWDEVEGALALGATDRQAMGLFTGEVVREALVPVLDQTRTTGLVTLPGAFVGALAGGASPADAARFQIAVLAGILCAQSLAAYVVVRRLAVPVLREGPGAAQGA